MSDEDIANFVAITNTDDSAAKRYLEFSGGNLDTAVTLFFESGGNIGSGTSNSNNDNDEQLAQRLQSETYSDDIRAPDQVVRARLADDGFGYDNDTSYFRNRPAIPFAQRGVFNQYETDIFDGDGDDEYEEENDSDNGARNYDRQFDAGSNLTSHQQRLAKLFRPPFDIIEKLTLDMARNKGRTEKKWILLNVQDTSVFACQVLNRDFWSKDLIKQIIKESFIFLQYQKTDPPVQEYINFQHVDDLPHIAILDPFSGEKFKTWNGIVPDVNTWVQQIQEFLEKYSLNPGHKNPAIKHKNKIDPNSLSEDQQLALAMQKSVSTGIDNDNEDDVEEIVANNKFNPISLDSDEEVGSEPEFEEDEDEDEDEDNEAEDDVEISEVKSINNKPQIEDSLEDLTEEEIFARIIAKDLSEPALNAPNTTRIQFRFGDGSRIVRNFYVNDKVEVIYQILKKKYKQVENKFFTLSYQRDNLLDKLNETIEEAGLLRSSILVEIVV